MKQPKQHTSKSQKPTYNKITPAQEQGKHNTTSKQNLLTQAQAKISRSGNLLKKLQT